MDSPNGETKINTDNMPEVSFSTGIHRDRPFSASTASRKSTTSVGSKTSRHPHTKLNKSDLARFFAQRPGLFENAVEHCQKQGIKDDLDGPLIGAWLLTEIDHWDCDKEKIVLITESSLIICKYDFIALKLLETKRLMLHNIKIIAIGDFVYPEKSIMPPRKHGGVRVIYGREEDFSLIERWNPFSGSVPYYTFSHHPIMYCPDESETVTFNVDDFYESLMQQTKSVYRLKKPGESVQLFEGNILIESYASITSMIFNQSLLGYSRERGGISF